MANPGMAVDDLVRELGSVRRAVWELRASFAVKAALERSIADAAEAVESTIDGRANPRRLLAARDALGLAEKMILKIDAQSRPH